MSELKTLAGVIGAALLAYAAGEDAVTERNNTKPAPEPEEKPAKTTKKTTKAEGPTLEQVQDKIRELVGASEDNKAGVLAAIKAVDKNAKRAGDFENDPAKLGALLDKLNAVGADAADGSDDDDLL